MSRPDRARRRVLRDRYKREHPVASDAEIPSSRLQQDPSLIADIISSLQVAHEAYRVLTQQEDERVMDWIESQFGTSWFRIDWSNVPGHVCKEWSDWQDRIRSLEQLIEEQALGSPTVDVVWSNAIRPSLQLRLEVVRRHAGLIFAADFDTWIVSRMEGWCIESYHEGEICWGRASRASSGVPPQRLDM